MPYAKGDETKAILLQTAREAFYEFGYAETTLRYISDKAGTNLGLVKYYFGSKAEIAHEVYRKIRAGFDDQLDLSDIRPDTPDMFILASALELYLCLISPQYGRFYYELISEPVVRHKVEERIALVLTKYMEDYYQDENLVELACASLTAIKPAIVSRAMKREEGNEIPAEDCLRYYIGCQLNYLRQPEEKAEDYIKILRGYYIAVAENFTPVMVKINKS